MLFDTHCHPNLSKQKDSKEIIKNFFKENKNSFLNFIWTNPETNNEVLELAKNNENCYCSIWIHPCDIYNLDLEKEILRLENLLIQEKSSISPFNKGNEYKNKIIAIWECWLDYYWLKPENDKEISKYIPEVQEKIVKLKKDLQKIFFEAQINLAKKFDLPIIIHNREAKDNVLEILKKTEYKKFIFHCYSENLDYAKKLLEFSPEGMISFSGIVTFKNAKEVAETAKNIPLKNILIETDSPYLTPTPFRWKEENEPSFVKYILEKIIELRDEKPEIIEKQILKNSKKIFNLD